MNRRTESRKRNIYSNYMEEIYSNNKCILCDENKIDDGDHYKSCIAHKVEREKLLEEIKQIFKRNGIDRKVYLWFGDNIENNEDEMSWNELKINSY